MRAFMMAKKNTGPADNKELTYEEALKQAEEIARAIDQGEIGLEKSITEYEKGVKLLQHCRSILDQAEARIQKLQLAEDGNLTAEPMDTPPSDEQ